MVPSTCCQRSSRKAVFSLVGQTTRQYLLLRNTVWHGFDHGLIGRKRSCGAPGEQFYSAASLMRMEQPCLPCLKSPCQIEKVRALLEQQLVDRPVPLAATASCGRRKSRESSLRI